MVFTGDLADGAPRMAGLVDVDALTGAVATTTTSTPGTATSTPDRGGRDPASTPQRPPVDPGSLPAGGGSNGQVNGTDATRPGVENPQNASRGPATEPRSQSQPAKAAAALTGSGAGSNGRGR